jgi:hypothetical protein
MNLNEDDDIDCLGVVRCCGAKAVTPSRLRLLHKRHATAIVREEVKDKANMISLANNRFNVQVGLLLSVG